MVIQPISHSTFNADMVPSCQLVQIGQDLIPRLLLKVGQREGWEVLGGLPLLPQDVVLWSSKRMLYSLGRYSWV